MARGAEVRAARRRRQYAERLAAIGRLATGVAHEVNNPAAYLLMNLRTCRDYVAELRPDLAAPPSADGAPRAVLLLDEMSDMLDDNIRGVERIVAVVQALRSYSRGAPDEARAGRPGRGLPRRRGPGRRSGPAPGPAAPRHRGRPAGDRRSTAPARGDRQPPGQRDRRGDRPARLGPRDRDRDRHPRARGPWSGSRTPGSGSRRRCASASSSRSSPPIGAARAAGSGWRSRGTSSSRPAAGSRSTASRAAGAAFEIVLPLEGASDAPATGFPLAEASAAGVVPLAEASAAGVRPLAEESAAGVVPLAEASAAGVVPLAEASAAGVVPLGGGVGGRGRAAGGGVGGRGRAAGGGVGGRGRAAGGGVGGRGRAAGGRSAAHPAPGHRRRGRAHLGHQRQQLAAHHDVDVANSGAEALEAVAARSFDVVLCDVMMPEHGRPGGARGPGRTTIPRLAERLIFMTGGLVRRAPRRAVAALAVPVLDKPVPLATLLDAIDPPATR